MKNTSFTVGTAFLLMHLLVVPGVVALARYQDQDYVARHLKEDRLWARKTGLPAGTVRKLRLLAGVADDSDTRIDSIDAKSLRARNQILLVTTGGNGHCLELYVFERGRKDYRLTWSATSMPGGAGYCRSSPYNPEAYVRAGKIMVKIPIFDYAPGVPKAKEFHTYIWDKGHYRHVGIRTVNVRKRGGRA